MFIYTHKKLQTRAPVHSFSHAGESKDHLKEKVSPPWFQTKLTIGSPDDAFEIEADALAEKVMRMPDPRLCGKPLPKSTHDFFKSRFRHNFCDVRIHNDEREAESAGLIHAQANTSCNKIVFGKEQYNPESASGRKLLAHELTHVLQQTGTFRNNPDGRQPFDLGKKESGGLAGQEFHSAENLVQRQAVKPQNEPKSKITADLRISIIVTGNIIDPVTGQVTGMRGIQRILYINSNGNVISETQNNVEWREDDAVEGPLPYEYPAAPERFDIIPGTSEQRYPIMTTHSEGGIAIHAPGRSEGCILAGQVIRDDIQIRLNNNEQIRGEITEVIDSRSPADQNQAPLPY